MAVEITVLRIGSKDEIFRLISEILDERMQVPVVKATDAIDDHERDRLSDIERLPASQRRYEPDEF